MELAGRLFLKPIRASLTAISTPSSPLSRSRIPFFGKFKPLKAWAKDLEPTLVYSVRNPRWKLCIQRCYTTNFFKSGSKFGMGGVFGGPVLFGAICFGPHTAHAMNEFDILGDDHHLDLSDADEDPHNFLVLARKLLLPVFLVITLLMNWDHPVILATKLVLILVGTKPSPFSVYLLIEQLRHQYIHQHPILYKFKSLYAKKVEVEDYIFLCVAQVELIDQKFTLIGILGGWWILPWSSCLAAFMELRNKILQNYAPNAAGIASKDDAPDAAAESPSRSLTPHCDLPTDVAPPGSSLIDAAKNVLSTELHSSSPNYEGIPEGNEATRGIEQNVHSVELNLGLPDQGSPGTVVEQEILGSISFPTIDAEVPSGAETVVSTDQGLPGTTIDREILGSISFPTTTKCQSETSEPTPKLPQIPHPSISVAIPTAASIVTPNIMATAPAADVIPEVSPALPSKEEMFDGVAHIFLPYLHKLYDRRGHMFEGVMKQSRFVRVMNLQFLGTLMQSLDEKPLGALTIEEVNSLCQGLNAIRFGHVDVRWLETSLQKARRSIQATQVRSELEKIQLEIERTEKFLQGLKNDHQKLIEHAKALEELAATLWSVDQSILENMLK